ncbi:restriction endonuclease subunit S [Pseudobutyrivibrio xylanivorans]|uniref:Type I restriction enzyme, S subunit n=1 Tax=Pseudobutyrivibrio xylanivorans TaxID=185007 RepID=A0A1G5RTI9_PSEXY|nr:restriction endonuclease subunit S [Pseudobutyrivibrio xylanivorans]SCZ77404.1 type I restriction enzyme, S subunit [Pseudobutyrivibrio xylanivorans]
MSEWKKLKLSECCSSIADGDHQPPPKAEAGIPFVTISNMTSTNQFDFSDTLFVPQDYYDKLDEKRKARKDDILYSVVGSFGIPVFMKEDKAFVFQRHIAILRPDNEKIVPRFLFYTMLTKDFYAKADAAAIGAAQRTVSLTALRNMEICIPDKIQQSKIVDTLADYDDLIESNQKQIKLLEEAAQRLYKEWFVNLRFPGHEKTEIVDGVPEGWSKGTLGDIAIDSGKRETKDNRKNYSYYLPIDCLPKKSLSYQQMNDIGLAESSLVAFKAKDILFGAMRPYFHKVVVARDNGLTRSTCFVINAKSKDVWEYLLMLLFDTDTIDYATQISVGTTMPYVRWKDFVNMSVLIPTIEMCKKFGEIVNPIINKANLLAEENIKIVEARDRLLPKLMSGEIEVGHDESEC